MARIRKSDKSRIVKTQIVWKIGKYIRLSREDGNIVSESVVNQDQILNDEIPGFFEDGLEVYLFSGFIRCADCGKSMVRHTSRNLVYYQCRTYQDKSRDKCAKHSIRLDILEKTVLAAVQKQIELVDSLAEMIDEINRAPVVHTESLRLNALLEQRTRELEKVTKVLDDLYMDWKSGDITRDQYRRMKVRFEEQSQQLQETIAHIQGECEILAQGIDTENPYLTAFLKHRNIDSLSRGLLVELVNAIYVHDDKSIEIEFNYADQYRRIAEYIENNQKELCETGGKAV